MIPNLTVTHWFESRTSDFPDNKALTFDGHTQTYAQLLDRVDRVAAVLREHGARRGDRVGYVGFNHAALLETFLAAARLGAIFVPLNFRLTGPELSYIINDAGLHTIVADRERQGVVDSIRGQAPIRTYVGVEAAGEGWLDYAGLASAADPLPVATSVSNEDLAILMYTSGTTGHPKGVMLTHANLWWNVTNLMHLFDTHAGDATLVTSPLFHIAGLNVTIFTTWRRGGHVLLHRSFDPVVAIEEIEREGVATLFGAPTMFQMMAALPQFADADLSSVRLIICGGAPVPIALIEQYQERGISMLNGYGLTETAPSAAFLMAEHSLLKPGSIGRAPIYSELKIVDDDGGTVSAGVTGEICVRGPNVTPGYWNNAEGSRDAIDEAGWFRTGDAGYVDEDGFLFLADRKKDIIVSGGENIASVEVENAIFSHPRVKDVAVIGTPDERWGETVTAIIVADGDSPSLEELRGFAGKSLARYKLPTKVHVVAELPRNPSGKLLKVDLRKQYADPDPPPTR